MDHGFLPFGISAMVPDGEALLLSESNGTIHRINPVTWEETGTLISPLAIEAMLLAAGVSCPWDLDNTGDVGINDFLVLLAAWGPVPTPDPPDFDGDGMVGIIDFLELLAHWGTCP